MNVENVVQAAVMMGQGMAGIFAVLGLIALVVVLLQRMDGGKK